MRNGIGAIIALGLLAGPAVAGLLPVHVDKSPEGVNYRYTYGIQLQSGAVLNSGDYFTIFDFAGLKAGTNTQPAGFEFSSSMTGRTPARLSPDDDSAISNLTWTYTGAGAKGEKDLGEFSAVSQYGLTVEDSFTGQSHRQIDGHLNGNITDTQVPVPQAPNSFVPEPSSLILCALGLPMLLGLLRARRGSMVSVYATA